MSRPHGWVELRAWALMAIPVGVLAGGVTGVLVNTMFTAAASDWLLAVAVAVVTGSSPLANLFSVYWSYLSRGRDKTKFLTRLQLALALCLLVIAAAPLNGFGLAVLVSAVLCAQALWCGIITVRAVIWRANYTRAARTAFAARAQVIGSLIGSLVGIAAGLAIDLGASYYRSVFVVAAACVAGSLLLMQRVRVRRQRSLLKAEDAANPDRAFRVGIFFEILRDDALYRAYMLWMMVFGGGNLMLAAPLILVLNENLGLASITQVAITASIPSLLVPVATPLWARVLADRHVIAFRTLNSRVFVIAHGLTLVGAVTAYLPALLLGAACLGAAMGGGALGWNLGHNDFAPAERATDYLGLHVTLTGIRGLLAPIIGVGAYGLLERASPGLGVWVGAIPLGLTSAGALGFYRLHHRQRATSEAGQ